MSGDLSAERRRFSSIESPQSPSTAPGGPIRTIAVVGGGMTGALFGLKMSVARPDIRVVVIERGRRLGRGVAYGACSPQHLLNVPVHRMEVGLSPRFSEWLTRAPQAADPLEGALVESGGDLQSAFVPRFLFGDYLEEQVAKATSFAPGPGLASVRGCAVRLLPNPRRGLRLEDGRDVEADTVVLATGNFAPGRPGGLDAWVHDSPRYVGDPWAHDAFEDLDSNDPLLLIGAGLTMVDVVLKLDAEGHKGPVLAVSRRGLAPQPHATGGAWPPFLEQDLPASPRRLARSIRDQIALAEAAGVPWQRVFDAARPAVPAAWRGWTPWQKRQFLRHLRTRWDVRRHRMAPRIANTLQTSIDRGRLTILAARLGGARPTADGICVVLKTREGDERRFTAARVINCTGPRRDLRNQGAPLMSDILCRGLALADDLGLGLETQNGALLDSTRRRSEWLFALGPLTCPSWWEITAVPEISVQVDRLVARLAQDASERVGHPGLTAADFLDLGAGI